MQMCNPNDSTINPDNVLSSRFSKIDEAMHILTKGLSEHDMQVSNPNLFDMHYTHKELGTVSMHRVSFSTDTTIQISNLEKNYYIVLPIRGQCAVNQKCLSTDTQQEINLDQYSRQACIISPDHINRIEVDANCVQQIIKIPAATIERQLTDLMGCSVSKTVKFDLKMFCDVGDGASWWRNINYLIKELENTDSMFCNKSIATEMGKVIVAGLLHGQHHNYSDDLKARNSTIVPGHVFRAESFIKENVYEDLTIDDIVTAAKVRKRTLYDGFKRFRGISPISYLHNLRLDLAREEFSKCNKETNITYVAMKLGFNHLGRFSISYKKRFGESPSITLQKRQLLM